MFKTLLYHFNKKKFISVVFEFYRQTNSCSRNPLIFVINRRNGIPYPSKYKTIERLEDLKVKNMRGGFQRRPELIGTNDLVYNQSTAKKYALSVKVKQLQTELTTKALEIASFSKTRSPNTRVLDIGCGSGISSRVLEEAGYYVIGTDSNNTMLNLFVNRGKGDPLQLNMTSFPFRSGTFGLAFSISALQWLFGNESTTKDLAVMFSSLHDCLEINGSAVIQFYPRNLVDVKTTVDTARNYFRDCSLVCDYPHSNRGKKLFLLLIKS